MNYKLCRFWFKLGYDENDNDKDKACIIGFLIDLYNNYIKFKKTLDVNINTNALMASELYYNYLCQLCLLSSYLRELGFNMPYMENDEDNLFIEKELYDEVGFYIGFNIYLKNKLNSEDEKMKEKLELRDRVEEYVKVVFENILNCYGSIGVKFAKIEKILN